MSVKVALRSFGIGLFVAGASLSLFQMQNEAKSNSTVKDTKTVSKDSVVMKKAEVKDLEEQIAQLQQKNKELQQASKKKIDSAPEVKTFTLNVEAGMGTREVSKKLKNAGMIADANTFEAYIINAGKSSSIQLGKTELNASMSQKEILQAITKRK
ncbi:MAG: endolytic transglycosylase MltG [Kurthia sp.]|nr:endolytic transglycosylase MltG [Candidatus Kurthia equi]